MIRSIGVILKSAREKKRVTLDDVYKNIKIHQNYIKALESDDYSVFSGKVHSKGFLKIYCEYLDLNVDDILALWRREYEHGFDAQLLPKRFVEPSKLIITPSFIAVVLVIVSLTFFFGYLYYQYRSFTGAPVLTINYPPDNLVTASDILDITGKTDLDSEVFVNSQKVILSPDGSFAESVRLKEGLNTISIRALNKFSKQTEYVKTIIYRAVTPAVQETSESTSSPII